MEAYWLFQGGKHRHSYESLGYQLHSARVIEGKFSWEDFLDPKAAP